MSKINIRNAVRRYLMESKGDKHSYGCVMLFFDIPKEQWSELTDMIDKDDIYIEEGDKSYGIENEPHVTVLYGLHSTIEDSTIKELVNEMETVVVNLKKISIFENDKFDVLKFDITGPSKTSLTKMNGKFSKLPHTTDYPDYHPHTTIAYLKSGTGKKYIKTLSGSDIITVKPTEVVYSKADGSNNKYKLK